MTIKSTSTFVRCEPSQIVEALVGLKDVRVLAYRRVGPDVELVIEQTVIERTCTTCGNAGQIKERPTVRYVDLPVYGQPMRLAWRKHRLICRRPDCAGTSWTSTDHRIAAKNCLLTTRCAKWATIRGCQMVCVSPLLIIEGKNYGHGDRRRDGGCARAVA